MTKSTYVVQGANSAMARALVELNPQHRFVLFSENPLGYAPEAEHLAFQGPALDEEFMKTSIKAAADQWQQIDGYAHFSGSILLKPLHLTRLDEWEEVMRRHVTTAVVGLRALLPILKQQGFGSVVLVSSTAARIGLQNHEAIAAAKGALEGLIRSCAATYAPVRFNGVAPGLTRSRMSQRIVENENALKTSLQLQSIPQLAEARDQAEMISFLLSERSQMISGQIIAVDGGLSTTKRLGL